MKYIFSLLLVFIFVNASDIQLKDTIEIEYKKFDYSIPMASDVEQKSILWETEIKKEYENTILFSKIESLLHKDNHDRNYFKIHELYIKYEGDNYDLIVGKDIKYWGAMELHNITDDYNKKNIIKDAFDESKKLGRIGISYNYYFENEDSISLIVAKDKMINDDETDHNASGYIKFSGSRDDLVSRDFSYILSSENEKFMMFHTVIVKDTIYKIEYLYSNKIKRYESAIGLEHTLYSVIGKKDLSLMIEYYKSNDEKSKYENSIFVGSQFSFNNSNDTTATVGVIKDKIKDEYSKTIEFKSRIYDDFKIKLSYLKNDSLTVYSVNTAYYF